MQRSVFAIAFFFITFQIGSGLWAQTDLFEVSKGSIHFTSNAPLELIQAQSEKLRGLIDPEKNTFAFTIPMTSFEGFNSPLQREHFNENYVESRKFPNATFLGKIIEQIDFSVDGQYTVRTKGRLNIHGVEQERIIKGKLNIKDGQLKIEATFSVLLADHDIAIPKIVHQKIAEEIELVLEASLQKDRP